MDYNLHALKFDSRSTRHNNVKTFSFRMDNYCERKVRHICCALCCKTEKIVVVGRRAFRLICQTVNIIL